MTRTKEQLQGFLARFAYYPVRDTVAVLWPFCALKNHVEWLKEANHFASVAMALCLCQW